MSRLFFALLFGIILVVSSCTTKKTEEPAAKETQESVMEDSLTQESGTPADTVQVGAEE
jgi:hypothetical protein